MAFKQLTDQMFVSPQVSLDDVKAASEAGIKMLISNRPDQEEAGQVPAEDMAAAAQAHGLAFRHIPILPGKATDTAVDAFGQALQEADGPVLAFCRSGMRSASLWALSQAGTRPVDDILSRASDAGYDLSGMKAALAARADG